MNHHHEDPRPAAARAATAAAAVCLGAVLLLVAAAAPALAAAPDGAQIYKDKCIGCHGPAGHGDTTMGKALKAGNLAGAEIQGQTDAQLTAAITSGKGKMQPFGKKLTPAEIAAVLAYVRTLRGKA